MRNIVLHSRIKVLRTLFARAWYLPLALAALIFAANWALTPHSSLLSRCGLNPLSLTHQDFLISLSDQPGWRLRGVEFDYAPLPHRALLLRFNDSGRSFDFVRISGIPEFHSGVFHFDEGRNASLAEFDPGAARPGRFSVCWDSKTLSVRRDDRELVSLEWTTPPGATYLMLQEGQPLTLPLPISGLRLKLLDPAGERRELSDSPSSTVLARLLLRTAMILLPLLLLISVVLRQLCPPRWLDQHPHRTVTVFGSFVALLSVLLVMALFIPLTKQFGLLTDWYSEFMDWGRINEERLESKRTVYNGGPIALHRSSERRVVVMGGSSTFGDPFNPSYPGVYTRRLAAMYDQCLDGPNGRVEVVNLGSPGESLKRNILQTYERVVLNHMQPDLVIFNSVVNNFVSSKRLLNVFHTFFMRARGVRRPIAGSDTTRFRADLERVIALAGEHDVRLLFVEEPISIDYFYGFNVIADFQRAQAEVCAAHGLPLVRTQEEFTRRRDEFLFYDWAHLTYWGNELLAQLIFAELQRTDLLGLGPCVAGPAAGDQPQPSSD